MKQSIALILIFMCSAKIVVSMTKKYQDSTGMEESPAAILYKMMEEQSAKGVMFGHQDDVAYGLVEKQWK